MTNFTTLITSNRSEMSALKATQFASKDEYIRWRDSVNALMDAVSDYQNANKTKCEDEILKSLRSIVFDKWDIVLSAFTNKSLGEKVGKHHTDFEYMLGIVGMIKKNPKTGEKDYMPVSQFAFRKGIENFISDRITGNNGVITSAKIEEEKAARREAKKAERKAKKEAENAKKQKKEKTKKDEKAEDKNIKTEEVKEEEKTAA